MDPLLQGLRDEGRLCSHGRFEVDRARQLEILRLDPHRAVLHLVRTAVLGGAGWMHIQSDGGQCDVEFPGTVALRRRWWGS